MFGRLSRGRKLLRLLAAAAAVPALMLVAAGWRRAHAPRAWGPGEVPVAFWSWRAEAPTRDEVERAAAETGARTLFLRAGQFELMKSGGVGRVRAVAGVMPQGCELHLVYNATPRLLKEFERVDEKALAACVVETFRADTARAERDGARVLGLQLDLDVPTRLLPRYRSVLRETRFALPAGVKLSVTGLPTWMESKELAGVLAEVDFWAPQFYGAEIPATVGRAIPIASPLDVARGVETRARAGRALLRGARRLRPGVGLRRARPTRRAARRPRPGARGVGPEPRTRRAARVRRGRRGRRRARGCGAARGRVAIRFPRALRHGHRRADGARGRTDRP